MFVENTGILRWMCSKIRIDRIRNEYFQQHLGVGSVVDKLRETRVRWFGHVKCRLAMTLLKKGFSMQVDGLRRKMGRPKRTWMEVGRINLRKCHLLLSMAKVDSHNKERGWMCLSI